MVIFNF